MKKLLLLLLALTLLFPSTTQAERWGKAFDITYDEVKARYANAPDTIFGNEVPLVFFNLGDGDYRRTYFAQAGRAINIALLCEDFSDKVVFVYSSIVTDELKNYDEAVDAGKTFTILMSRLLFAIDESIGPVESASLFGKGEFFTESIKTEGVQRNKVIGDMYFAVVNNGKEVQLMVRRNDFFDSKEEFLEYVGTYK